MGLLDHILSGMAGTAGGGQSSGIQNVLTSLLGGGSSQSGMMGQPGMTGGGIGNLLQLVSMFQNSGHGGIVDSWVGTGQNQNISPDQLHSVLGEDRVSDLSHQSGMPTHDLLSQLSQHLPQIIDQLTPNGRLP